MQEMKFLPYQVWSQSTLRLQLPGKVELVVHIAEKKVPPILQVLLAMSDTDSNLLINARVSLD